MFGRFNNCAIGDASSVVIPPSLSWNPTKYFSKPINALVFFKGHHRVNEKILERGQVEIECSKEFPEEIRGWIAYDRDCLHFIYVKSPVRRFGVSRLLMNGHNFKEYSHLNDNVKYILPGATYNPYTFFMNL